MPRKTKDTENNEVELEESKVKKASKSATPKKKTTTSKKVSTAKTEKKSSDTKKEEPVKKEASAKNKTTTKKAEVTPKKETTKKTSTTKKSVEPKSESVLKKTTTKKATTKKTVEKDVAPAIKKVSTKKAASTTKKATPKKSTIKKDGAIDESEVETKSKTSTKTAKTSTTSKKIVAKKTTTKKTTIKKSATVKKATTKKVASKKNDVVEYYDLPYRYNQTVVKILAQTPTNLFIYWDISDEDRENFKKQYGDNFFETTKPILKIYNDTMNYNFEVDINDFANSWYLRVNDSKCDYRVELGRRPINFQPQINTDYIYISSSNEIESPNDRILFDRLGEMVYFRNTKTNVTHGKSIANLSFIKNIGRIYNIYNLYKELYKDEDLDNFTNTSSSTSSRFF